MCHEQTPTRQGRLKKALLRPAKNLLERATGVKVIRTPPHGMDLHADILRLAPNERISIIFDVGANIGQSALSMNRAYPRATIHSFEPCEESYNALRAAAAPFPGIHPHRLGLGKARASGFLVPADRSTRHRVSTEPSAQTTEKFEVTTVVDFCNENSITEVSLLKIDTEGHDLKVLEGAAAMLRDGRIGFVQVEAGFGLDNATHVDFRAILDFMQAYGYALFGFYEQKHEWTRREPQLRRSDVVFISDSISKRNAGKAPL